MNHRSVTLIIDSRVENVSLTAMTAHRLSEASGLTSQQCYNIELCVAEAVTNVVEHTFGFETGHPVEVEISLYDDRIEIVISDDGKPVPAPKPRSIEFDPEDLSTLLEGGRGLFLLEQLLSRVEYERDGDRNRLTLVHEIPATSESKPQSAAG